MRVAKSVFSVNVTTTLWCAIMRNIYNSSFTDDDPRLNLLDCNLVRGYNNPDNPNKTKRDRVYVYSIELIAAHSLTSP